LTDIRSRARLTGQDRSPDELHDMIVEAWLARAPKRVAADYLNTQGEG
jgi:hypothetical protein